MSAARLKSASTWRALAVALAVGSCAALWLTCSAVRPEDDRTATAQVRTFLYRDIEGLRVVTVAADLAQPIPGAGTLLVGAILDDIELVPVDALSSASIRTAEGEPALKEQRVEVSAGYRADLGRREAPMTLEGLARVSTEPDYRSLAAQLAWSAAVLQQNTTLSASIGFAHDTIDPNRQVQPDDEGRWPDSHDDVRLSAGVIQLVGPRLSLSGGCAYSRQAGALTSPYRRASVYYGRLGFLSGYYPEAERHPDVRGRGTCYLGVSWYLGANVALHPRLGGYFDTWGVTAIIPEVALVVEPFSRLLVTANVRYYRQSAASFYQPQYRELEPLRTGDRRLGRLEEQAAGLTLDWTLVGEAGRAGAFDLIVGYQLSRLAYPDLDDVDPVTAHVGSLGLRLSY